MNRFIVFSETRKDWIAPQYDDIYVLTGPLQKREGDIAEIEVGPRKLFTPPRRVRVMVERSSNGYWWLVEIKA